MIAKTLKKNVIASACALACVSITSISIAQTAANASERNTGAMQNNANMGGAGYGHPDSKAAVQSDSSRVQAAGASSQAGASAQGTGSSQAEDKSQLGKAAAGPVEASDTMQQINNAAQVVQKMTSDPELKKLMQQAKGIFIAPQYVRGGLGVGMRAGEGVLMANNKGQWKGPVFYNYGGISIGAQAGAETGAIAMLLMNEKALNNFMQENNFTLNAGAGLTILNYTAKAQVDASKGDIITWSDTGGAFANATVGITDVHFDDDENQAFYNKKKVAAKEIIGGKVKGKEAKTLTQALPGGK